MTGQYFQSCLQGIQVFTVVGEDDSMDQLLLVDFGNGHICLGEKGIDG